MAVKNFLLIRHGKTQSNIQRRYVGDPDEPLSETGRRDAGMLAGKNLLPRVDRLLCGPALRCRQTAEILFPGVPYELCSMSEIDFGVFKNKNADELLGDKDYGRWLSTNCMGNIPGGDSVTEFKNRCCENFLHIAEAAPEGTTALVIHGGNIMAVMERFARPKKDFYDYHVPNCGHILCRFADGVLISGKEALPSDDVIPALDSGAVFSRGGPV